MLSGRGQEKIAVAGLMQRKPVTTIEDLLAVMAALRTPVTGCPWDLEQTFSTIAPYTIEEAYEVAEAIERADMGELKEELGDLLLQVVYHSRLAEEAGAFDFADVVAAITEKMIRRHPHVFGDETARSAGMAKGLWEELKAAEIRAKAASAPPDDTVPAQSVLDSVPTGLPALTRAVKLQDKAARVGFDWPSLAPVFAKLKEELAELEAVLAEGQQSKIAEEFGDLLFVIANVGRHLRIDPEAALRSANAKFIRRFRHIEARLAAMGKTPDRSDLEEMDALWDEAKAHERG
jgi:MazG family protein